MLIRDHLPYPRKRNSEIEDDSTCIQGGNRSGQKKRPDLENDIKLPQNNDERNGTKAECPTLTNANLSNKEDATFEVTCAPEADDLRIRSGWLSVAMVLDRFFFLTYLTFVIVALVTIFPKP